jgi:hypothetical protein
MEPEAGLRSEPFIGMSLPEEMDNEIEEQAAPELSPEFKQVRFFAFLDFRTILLTRICAYSNSSHTIFFFKF